jgi:hypothetical protein
MDSIENQIHDGADSVLDRVVLNDGDTFAMGSADEFEIDRPDRSERRKVPARRP